MSGEKIMWKDAGSWQALASLVTLSPVTLWLGWNAYRDRPEYHDDTDPTSEVDVGVE